MVGRLIRRLRGEQGLSLTHGATLGRLDRCGAQSVGDLAAAEHVRPQSMSQTLADLEGEGLIRRSPDERDGRRTLIELTEEGRRVLFADRARREGWLARAIAEGLSDDERAALERALPLLDRLSQM